MSTSSTHFKSLQDAKVIPDGDLLLLSVDKPELFAEIVDRYQRAFVRKATSILKSDDEAYDVVQDTFVRIYSAAKKFKQQEGAFFASWAYTILVNQCYTAYSKKHKHESVSFENEPELLEVVDGLIDWTTSGCR